ncbi:MAG: Hsp20/alpha crystallin family protein [Thermoproteota archaeon]
MTLGPEGEPEIREFGNITPGQGSSKPRTNVKEQREPLIDIMEADGELEIVAELPGVEKKDIQLRGTEDSLTVSVDTPERKYHKKVELPTKIDLKQAKSTYNDGVLTITIPKMEEKEPVG